MPAPDEDTHALLFASANASVHFALHCLEPVGLHLRAALNGRDAKGRRYVGTGDRLLERSQHRCGCAGVVGVGTARTVTSKQAHLEVTQ